MKKRLKRKKDANEKKMKKRLKRKKDAKEKKEVNQFFLFHEIRPNAWGRIMRSPYLMAI